MYTTILRPFLFRLTERDPEYAHLLTARLLTLLSYWPGLIHALRTTTACTHPSLRRHVFGLDFPNPIGIAGGFDKHGTMVPALAALGFGFLEVGTVTWHPQPGNLRPRVFRFPRDEALVNRMGFNNAGAHALAARLQRLPTPHTVPIGISIGKSRITPPEEAIEDYCASLRTVAPYADYIAINVSSPNTPGLRALQARAQLDDLLRALQTTIAQCPRPVPLLVKVGPDLSLHTLADVLSVCLENQISGMIATNTYPVGQSNEGMAPSGGLSGRPIHAMAVRTVRFLAHESTAQMPIIGVGGIHGADDLLRMQDAGACLFQIYTGLVYRGPGVLDELCQRLRHA